VKTPAHLGRPFCFDCGKESFPNEEEARRSLANYQHKHKDGPGRKQPTRAYPCPAGHGWHLTHKDRDTRRSRRG
jgi:hypothetical protein